METIHSYNEISIQLSDIFKDILDALKISLVDACEHIAEIKYTKSLTQCYSTPYLHVLDHVSSDYYMTFLYNRTVLVSDALCKLNDIDYFTGNIKLILEKTQLDKDFYSLTMIRLIKIKNILLPLSNT